MHVATEYGFETIIEPFRPWHGTQDQQYVLPTYQDTLYADVISEACGALVEEWGKYKVA